MRRRGGRGRTLLQLLGSAGRLSDVLSRLQFLAHDRQLSAPAYAVIFVLVGIYAVRHPALSKWIDRYAYRAMPFVLIIVGIYILANTVTDMMPD